MPGFDNFDFSLKDTVNEMNQRLKAQPMEDDGDAEEDLLLLLSSSSFLSNLFYFFGGVIFKSKR